MTTDDDVYQEIINPAAVDQWSLVLGMSHKQYNFLPNYLKLFPPVIGKTVSNTGSRTYI